ncbi:MAG: hypothetical protein P4M11_09845 [Candidatus Pacebacteria bacterium]|nr:hypothetical protein [Candidatus Paceibacterota bacterium]
MDFTSTMTADKPGAGVGVQDCILVIEYYRTDGHLARRNLDFLCTDDSNKHDYHFVLQVWIYLFLHLELNTLFDQIIVWTDGGPHHFKTRYCQFMWHALSCLRFDNKPIIHNFFASYHGHSLADGHAAVVKRCLHTRYLLTELERATHQANASWGPSNVDEVADLIRANCENTEVVVFKDDRDQEKKPQVRQVPEIKTLYSLTYEKGKCFGKVKTGYPGIKEFSFY